MQVLAPVPQIGLYCLAEHFAVQVGTQLEAREGGQYLPVQQLIRTSANNVCCYLTDKKQKLLHQNYPCANIKSESQLLFSSKIQ